MRVFGISLHAAAPSPAPAGPHRRVGIWRFKQRKLDTSPARSCRNKGLPLAVLKRPSMSSTLNVPKVAYAVLDLILNPNRVHFVLLDSDAVKICECETEFSESSVESVHRGISEYLDKNSRRINLLLALRGIHGQEDTGTS